MIPLRRSFYSTYSKVISIKQALTCSSSLNKNIKVQGWVRSVRSQKKYTFIDINDGSCHKHLQAVSSSDLSTDDLSLGTSVLLEGTLVTSTHPAQPVELTVSSISILGSCDNHLYPFRARANHPLEYVRQWPHLRARTEGFSSVLRVRNTASMAVHKYFQSQGYIQVHTPILTSSDCEGAGDLFEVLPTSRTETDHFFGVPAHLSVSGQLHAETLACGMSKVYTFGPVFRAERSKSRRHLSEFYMIEAETVTSNNERCPLEAIMEVSEDLCKSIVERVLCTNQDDIEFFHSKFSSRKDTKQLLCNMLDNSFKRIRYEEAMELLLDVCKEKEKFEVQPEEGQGLGAEHERYLVEHFGGSPVFVTHFPAAIKPFYAKTAEHNHTQALAMDLLMPGVGEVVGGSMREERLDILQERLQKLKIDEDYQWYLDLRRFGTMSHGGFGLGFERFLQVILGIENIRDVIPYSRHMNSCQM